MSEKLKLCPFCGGDPCMVQQTKVNWCVSCHTCGADSGWGSPAEVIKLWNCRALESASPSTDYDMGYKAGEEFAIKRLRLESASQPGGGEADGEKFRSILAAVVGEIQKDDGRYDGNAPGHAHDIPGVWDNDNGAKSGKPCSWCRTWKLARESLGLAAPSAGNSGAEGNAAPTTGHSHEHP